MKRPAFVSVLLLIASSLAADPLADLKTSLAKLRGLQSVQATMERQSFSQTKEEGAGEEEQSKVSVFIEDGPDGIKLIYPRALLEQADQEVRANSADPEKGTGTRSGIQSVDALEAHHFLNFAPTLLNQLQRAELKTTRAVQHQGKRATELSLKLSIPLSKASRKRVKKAETTMSVVVGENGLPLTIDRQDLFKASFLLLSFENIHKASYSFALHADRLVAVRAQTENSGSGLGQKFQQKETTTVVIR